MHLIQEPNAWIALLTLTFLEIILGVDNIVFLSVISSKLPQENQSRARNIGLGLAMIFRILLLFGIQWVIGLTRPIVSFSTDFISGAISGQAIIIGLGGIFLLYKSVSEIHHKIEYRQENHHISAKKLIPTIIQIALLNIVFSFDSILTAIGLVSFDEFGSGGALLIMVSSVVISMVVMIAFAGAVTRFVNTHPTVQILAFSFLILIGVMLITEAAHLSDLRVMNSEVGTIPKGYLYFAIAFSLFVEFINIKIKKKQV